MLRFLQQTPTQVVGVSFRLLQAILCGTPSHILYRAHVGLAVETWGLAPSNGTQRVLLSAHRGGSEREQLQFAVLSKLESMA